MKPDDVIFIRAAYHCVCEDMDYRRRNNIAIPKWMRQHHLTLERWIHLLTLLSRVRQEFDTQLIELGCTPDYISAREAAEILGTSQRHITRHAKDYGGVLIDGRWMFNRDHITQLEESN